jgi:ring-1,2-phenylacetyl-CoA epoxidase subunit PaaC
MNGSLPMTPPSPHVAYLLRLGDSALINAQRLIEWCGQGPVLEEEVALANLAMDHLGQARALLAHAGAIEGQCRDEDALAFLRDSVDFCNLLLVELPNGDFAETMVRQLLYSAWLVELYGALATSADPQLAAIAAKSAKEVAYHRRHAATWVIRLGDGTQESRRRAQAALDALWMFTGELFAMDEVDRAMVGAGIGADLAALKPVWDEVVDLTLAEARLARPEDGWMQSGGKQGRHTEHLVPLLAEMQILQRSHPGARW